MRKPDGRKLLEYALWCVLLGSLFLHLFRLFSDFDFFWHLRTGRWILENGSLPHEDPFSFTASPSHTEREQFILTSYWLSQIIYYLFYLAAGWPGLAALRFVIMGTLVYVVFRRRDGDRTVFLGVAAIALLVIVHSYALERPQVFSFLMLGVFLRLLDALRRNGSEDSGLMPPARAAIYMSLLMLIWANMHGGYIVGIAVMAFVLGFEGLKFAWSGLHPMSRSAYLRLCSACAAATVVSFVNPNTWHAFSFMSGIRADIAAQIMEHKSTMEVFALVNDKTMIVYWAMLAIAMIGVFVRPGNIDITEVALTAAFGYASFTQMRYVAFFLIAAVPIVARTLSLWRHTAPVRVATACAAVLLMVFFTWGERRNLESIYNAGWINGYVCPVAAADFIASADLKGNMFNHYNWGGYLIWRSAPQKKVFIDGRNMYFDLFIANQMIVYAVDKNGPVWKRVFDMYGIRYVVMRIFEDSGGVYGLVDALLNDGEWLPVFFRDNSIIFVKNTPENYPVLKTYSIPKDYIVDDMVRRFSSLVRNNPYELGPRIALGDLYMRKHMRAEAVSAYEGALRLAPLNSAIKSKVESARIGR